MEGASLFPEEGRSKVQGFSSFPFSQKRREFTTRKERDTGPTPTQSLRGGKERAHLEAENLGLRGEKLVSSTYY